MGKSVPYNFAGIALVDNNLSINIDLSVLSKSYLTTFSGIWNRNNTKL